MSAAAVSLFDRPTQPVFGVASQWMQDTLGGSLATSICVIAVAILGLLLLAGRFQIRRGAEVVLGCFLLLGAGLLAIQLQGTARNLAGSERGSSVEIIAPEPSPTKPPPPANYDPYAGASLRRDR